MIILPQEHNSLGLDVSQEEKLNICKNKHT